jgi:hypothetical protein
MQADMALADKADYLIALFGASAVAVVLERIADAVRLSDDLEVGRLDRLLQRVERQLQQPRQAGGSAVPLRLPDWIAEPASDLMRA